MTRPALVALLGGSLLAGCAVRPPTGPTVLAVPPEGKNLAQFQQEEANCRNYAFNQIGITPAQGANQAAVGSAAIGTGLGAAAGALLGAAAGSPGTGAAVGAGAGLLGGSAVGASNAQVSSAGLQARYDQAYTQCLASTGNQINTAFAFGSPYYYRPYPYPYYSPYFGGYYGPGFFGPSFGLGLGFGVGGYGRYYGGGPRFYGGGSRSFGGGGFIGGLGRGGGGGGARIGGFRH